MQEMFAFEAPIPFHLFIYGLPGIRNELHWHSFYEIGYCIEGSGMFYFADRTVAVSEGDLLLMPPYEPHIAQSDPGSDCRFYFAYFSELLFPEEDRQLLYAFRQTSVRHEKTLLEQMPDLTSLRVFFASMLKEYEEKKTGYVSMLRAHMLDLCVRIHRAEESLHSQESWNGMLKGLNQVKPALDFVDNHYREPIGLKDISAVLSLSESRARHLFKASVGKGFKQYLAFVRIQEAKRLLTMTDLSATEVFLACGFQSAAPFYRSFQQLVGLSPLQYRHRLQFQK